MNTVTYHDGIPIQIGDRVQIRRFIFWKSMATVVYVPGISPKRRDMEDESAGPENCRRRICIKYDNSQFSAMDVDSDGKIMDKKLTFVSRGDSRDGITPDNIISESDKYGREDDALFPPKTGIRLLKNPERSLNKLSGNPNLPDGVEWPKNPQGKELDLLAQFCCENLPPGLGLPDHGMLYFFYDIEEMPWGLYPSDRKLWKIIYTELTPSQTPRMRTDKPSKDFQEVFIKFQVFESALSDAYRVGEETDRHQLLGHPLWIQTQACEIDKEQILLLQLDSDDHEDGPGWMWGDAGRIYFTIKPEDLAACRFDNAEMTLECY